MASITSLGAGSGIFSNDLVDQLINADRRPAELRLDQKQQRAELAISAFGKIRSTIEGIKSPLEALAKPGGLQAFTGTSSNEGVATVAIDPTKASRGSYSLNVTQLAQAQSLASPAGVYTESNTTTVGSGTLTLNVGGVSTDIAVDGSNNTLDGLAAAINDANAGVSAGVVDTGSGFRLVMTADESGEANAIQISVADDDGNQTDTNGLSQFVFDGVTSNLDETVPPKDALMEINGIPVSRSTNTVEGIVEGVTFDLKSVGTSSVKVEQDSELVAGRVQEFVDKFNALQDVIKQASGFNAASGQGGVLSGDSSLRSIQSDLRSILTSVPAGLEGSSVRILADIGVTTDPSTGKLEFDKAKFTDQLEANPGAVEALFAGKDGAPGIAERATTLVTDVLDSDGLLSNRTDGLSRTLTEIQDQRDKLDMRLETLRERLVRQFSAADSLISRLQSTGDYVSQQLAAIAPNNDQN
ncbi:flagellar filament capping protein FliD [Marinobacter salicampi]|uniref:flagellar filament capping protein FliD n=1 Tax=Marinobacter salicampi TaxID=435907 RepID=UPI001408590A|nr:flagellar filament capping protein FliD [Marinobacter salicampi]